MKALFCVLLSWLALNLFAICSALSTQPIIVLIAFDGIPQNYLQLGYTPTLQDLISTSATTEWMLRQFPERTLPNLQSIATGLYPEIHGVLGDHIFDEKYECIGYGEKMYTRKVNIMPIWSLNEISGGGRHSGVITWPGAEFRYQNKVDSTYRINLTDCYSWEHRVNFTLNWLKNDKEPANLILLHYEADQSRDTESLPKFMQQIDDKIKYYFEQLSEHGIRDKVNTIILIDHTLTNVNVNVMPGCNRVLTNQLSNCKAEIWKNVEQASKQLNAFKAAQYAKFKTNLIRKGVLSQKAERYLNAQQDKIFEHPAKFLRIFDQEEQIPGMFPLFIANGPLFEANFVAEPFENTDIYALVSHLLNLNQPIITINGSIKGIQDVLKLKNEPVYDKIILKVILFFLVGLLLLAFAWYILRVRKQERVRL